MTETVLKHIEVDQASLLTVSIKIPTHLVDNVIAAVDVKGFAGNELCCIMG